MSRPTSWLQRWSELAEALVGADLEQSDVEVALWIARQSLGWRREDTDRFASVSVLVERTGRAESTVYAALRRLQQQGIVVCVERGKATRRPNRYRIAPVSTWTCRWRGSTPATARRGLASDGTDPNSSGPGLSTPPTHRRQRQEEETGEKTPGREALEDPQDQEAASLLDHWLHLAERSTAPSGRVRVGLLDALAEHLADHSCDDIRTMLDHLAQSPWWRGRSDNGPSVDLFSSRPMSWLRSDKAAEFAGRVEAAQEWSNRAGSRAAPPGNGTGTWLAAEGNADWLLRQRDRASSYGYTLTAERLREEAEQGGCPLPDGAADGLLVWLEERS